MCDRWLAVEHDDGKIERTLSPADAEELTRFNLLFQTEVRKNLTDSHIWFSVVKRPARSNFTRVQRLSCCLCILLTTMLASAMFYGRGPSLSSTVKVGPFRFSVQQLFIAVMSSMVVLPVNVLIVWIFRNARYKNTVKERKKHQEAQYAERRGNNNTENGKSRNDDHQGGMLFVLQMLQSSRHSKAKYSCSNCISQVL